MNHSQTYIELFADFRGQYRQLLEKFLKNSFTPEDFLNEAYQLGRKAVLNRFNVLSIAAIHQDCLIDYLQRAYPNNHILTADKANLMLEEVLAPIAMLTQEDFREAIKLLNNRSVEFVVRFRGLQQEIINRKHIEEQTNRMKNEFLANMSHELRTPLNAIIGFSELIYSEKVGPISAEHKEYLGDVLSNSKHLLRLINEVLDLSKLEAGKMEFYPEMINLNQIISEVSDAMGALLVQKKITIESYFDPALTYVIIDPNKFKQILYNYLSNAIKFSDKGGKVHISTQSEENGYFRIAVADHGIGISKDKISQLFVAFQQLDTSATKNYQGTGLGLALTRRIVEAQGGKVGVTSKPGKGSTFFAVLPCAPLNQTE